MTACLERDLARAAVVPLPRKHVPNFLARTQILGAHAVRWQVCGAGLLTLGLEPRHLAQLLETTAYHELASPAHRPVTCLPVERSARTYRGTYSASFQLSHLTADGLATLYVRTGGRRP